MTISTTLLFSRAVSLMTRQQSELAQIQEKVSTGKELVRPSDSPALAVNISRIKSTIGQMDAYKNSLNSVNDRLRIEESYLDGAKDVMIKLKQLNLQGANASLSNRDREVVALEVDELISEVKNLANGTDANGNYLFAGSRVTTPPYREGNDGVIRYQGDNFRPEIDYTSDRRSSVGRNGLDVFKPVITGAVVDQIPGEYGIELSGTLETGDHYQLNIDGQLIDYTVRAGDSVADVLTRLAFQINETFDDPAGPRTSASVRGSQLIVHALDGSPRAISGSTSNTSPATNDLSVSLQEQNDSVWGLDISGTTEPGDQITFSIGSRTLNYVIPDSAQGQDKEAVVQALVAEVNSTGLFSESVSFEVDAQNDQRVLLRLVRDNVGDISVDTKERSAINNQGLVFTTLQAPRSSYPERMEFFESLQEVSKFLREGDQDKIQGKLDHIDQMLDIITLSLADVGSEMQSIESEISINEDLKLQLETTLSSKEDVDFTTAITDLQAKMMSLEAAQSSFAKISQLSVFDYIR